MASQGHSRSIVLKLLRAAFSAFVRTSAGDKGHYEVERKFHLNEEEAGRLPERLASLGYTYAGTASMTDTFLPPAAQGELMRVRQERIGEAPPKTLLTFKKWVATATGKERQETERQVRPTTGLVWMVLGRIVKGSTLLSFSKERQLYEGKLAGADAVISIDQVDGLGEFSGWYLEGEVLVPIGGDTDRYTQAIFEFVRELLGDQREDVKRSYQDMLNASRQ